MDRWKNCRLAATLLLGYLCFPLQACGQEVGGGGSSGASLQPLVVSSGQQVIDASNLNNLSALSVASGATAIIDFGQTSILNVTGNIENSGSIFAVSSNPAVQTASFSALNIMNNPGSLLTTVIPTGGFSGISNLVQNLNLSLSAVNNIVNAGTISSAGSLNIVAGNSIANSGVISAVQNVSMVSGIAGLLNSGTISSIAGSINISNLASQNLIINNTNGSMQALLDSINLSTLASNSLDKLNLDVLGGDFISRELNISTQEGIASIDVSDITGTLNVSAGEVHVTSRTDNLQLGSMNITGDPTFWNPSGNIQIMGNLSFSGQNLAIVASGDITTAGSTSAVTIDTSSAGNAGNILIVAGVAMTPNSGGTGANTSGMADTTTSLTLSGASTSGGVIDLTQGAGLSQINASSTSNGQGGSVTLVAYQGSGGGTINLPTSSSINTGTALSNGFTVNGNVTVIAGSTASGSTVNLGSINASGNSVNPSINNGLVNVFSATPQMYQSVNQTSTFTAMNGGQLATQNYLIITDATNVAAGQTYVINPNGANSETVTVGPGYLSGSTTVPITSPLKNAHGSSEPLVVSVSSVQTFVNAGPNGPILQNGAIFAPGTLQNGNITVGSISSGANVVIGTSAASGGGTVNLNGNITLSQNPTASLPYNDTPVLQITGNQVNIGSGSTTISSAISGCSFCQDQLNIFTQNLSNAGTISGSFVNIENKAAGNLTVSNAGTISGINPGTTAGNPWVNIASAGGITFNSGSLTFGTISVPSWGVITVSAADNNQILFNNTQFFNGGTGGLVSFSAQGATGAVNLAAGTAIKSTGGPLLSFSSPNINFAGGSSIQGIGASDMIFRSGSLVNSPQPLSFSVDAGASAYIQSAAGTNIILRPVDGQNLNFNSSGAGASLEFQTANTFLFTGTNQAGTVGTIVINPNISVSATSSVSAVDPNGGIKGIAFQPYVGPAFSPGNFTLFGTYTYPQVILLMAPIAETGLFQNLGTYSQGAFLGPGSPDASQKSSYVISGAARYTIEAAKQMGLTVSAGAYSQNPDKSVNVPPTEAEIDFALQQAQKFGNVMDLVVGNECIIADGSGNIATSVGSLVKAINYAQTTRASFGFNSLTLPVTTRQTYGSLSGVNDPSNDISPQTINLLNGCSGCYSIATYSGVDDHVYADVYPYYDGTNGDGSSVPGSVIGYIAPSGTSSTSITAISSSDFQTLVTAAGTPPAPPGPIPAPPPVTVGIQADLNGTISAFQAKSITPKLWVAETGWATASTQTSGGAPTTALPNNAPQANTQLAAYYYPDMQSWSYSNKSSNALGYQIPVNGYFEAYDEPWKFSATPWQGGEPNFGIWTATGTNLTASNPTPAPQYQLTGVSQKFTLPIFNQSKTAPLPAIPQAAAPGVAGANSGLPTAPNSNLLAFNQAFFSQSLSAVNTAVADSRGTIIPTDINPEVKTASDVATANPNAFSTMAGTLSSGTNPAMTGNLVFNQSQLELNPSGSFVTFSGSNLLLAPDHDLAVDTNLARIQLDAGSAVMLIQTGGELAIFALHDDHSGSVRVSVDGQTLQIPVGRQLVLSKDKDSKFDNLNPSGIGYRNLSGGKVGGLKAFLSEFSLPTALTSTQSLRQLMKSANKEERDLARKLMKTAAAMIVVGKNKSPFKSSR